MLALSPPLFSTTYGWPLEDLIAQNLQQGYCNEANSYHSLLDFPTFDPIQQDFVPKNSISSGVNCGNVDDLMMVAKKLNHNASERDRRKRVNDLYAFLRSLLPMSTDQKKKVSIPGTVSRALKYIPELQKEVETLLLKRENLRSYSSSTATRMQEPLGIKKQSAKDTTIKTSSLVVSSVSVLGEKEAVIQLIFSTDHMSKNKEVGMFSKVLEYLEQEEDGFVLLNATSFKCSGEGRLLNTLHLKVQGDNKIEAEKLKEKLCSFQQ